VGILAKALTGKPLILAFRVAFPKHYLRPNGGGILRTRRVKRRGCEAMAEVDRGLRRKQAYLDTMLLLTAKGTHEEPPLRATCRCEVMTTRSIPKCLIGRQFNIAAPAPASTDPLSLSFHAYNTVHGISAQTHGQNANYPTPQDVPLHRICPILFTPAHPRRSCATHPRRMGTLSTFTHRESMMAPRRNAYSYLVITVGQFAYP